MNDVDLTPDELLDALRKARARIAELESSVVSSRLFGGLLEAAPDGMILTDPTGTIRLANPQAERMLGYGSGELEGQPIEVLVPEPLRGPHLRHREGYVHWPSPRRMGIGMQLVARRRDGTEIPAEISLAPLDTPEGRFIVSAIRDVTERRETEQMLQRQSEALARSNDQLQQFAYVASHDLQEPLRMVSRYLQLVERRYADKLDQDGREFIDFAVDGAKRMQALINDLLTYSRIGTRPILTPVDLNEAVRKVLQDLEVAVREAGATVNVERLPTIVSDPTEMGQLFLNLIGNALKFRRPDVAPVIEVGARRDDEGWTLWVEDNGIGMDPQYRDRIFQIFQRLHTREEYPGTGIGLAICKRIVERHGGAIKVETALDEGTTFLFNFPDRRPA